MTSITSTWFEKSEKILILRRLHREERRRLWVWTLWDLFKRTQFWTTFLQKYRLTNNTEPESPKTIWIFQIKKKSTCTPHSNSERILIEFNKHFSYCHFYISLEYSIYTWGILFHFKSTLIVIRGRFQHLSCKRLVFCSPISCPEMCFFMRTTCTLKVWADDYFGQQKSLLL